MKKEINPFDLKKADLQIYTTGRCKHRHLYYEHPNCFETEILQQGKKYKIGVLDIETFGMGFNANQGIILTYHIKEYGKNKYYKGKIKLKDLRSKDKDKNITKQLVKDLQQFDRIITYNGSKFDLPYIRTRAVKWKIPFPKYKHMTHIDLYYIIKYKFKFRFSSLGQACDFFHINGKDHLNYEIWIDAMTGNQQSLQKIFKHNKWDVDITELLHDEVIIFSRQTNRSI